MALTAADLAQIQAMINAAPTVGEGFAQPIVAGQNLLIPGIQSPNFSLSGETGWAILKNGNAYFFNVVAEGSVTASSVIIEGATGTVLIYSGVPSAGNLIGAWAGQSGSDSAGNSWDTGLNLGAAGGSQVLGNPSVNSAISVTSLITGIVQAALQLTTTDASEVLPGDLAAVILGSGSTAKMATALTSPVGAGAGAALLLEAENDGGTDTAVITLGTTTTPDDSTIVFSPVMTLAPYALLLYGASSGTVVVTKTSGSGTISIPAGVATALAECWGGGGGGGSGASAGDGGGGGGGEYSAEPALAVTGGGTVAYSVGSGGAGSSSGGNGTAGGSSTLTGTSATATGHGGAGGSAGTPGTGGAGGSGYGGTTEHHGGNGGNGGGANQGGGGGGSSAGPAAAGNAGSASHSSSGGAGGTAPTGGGAGGNGGADGGNGSNGSAPGGGGGGGGTGGGPTVTGGGNGNAGHVRLTYSTGTPTILTSIAAAGGTDQFGTAYLAGVSPLPLASQASAPAASAAGATVYADAGGAASQVTAAGLAGNLSTSIGKGVQSSTTVTGTTGALGSSTVPAGDAEDGSVYEIYLFGNGTWGSTQEVLTLGVAVNGTVIGAAQGPAAAAFSASAAFRWNARGTVVIRTTGASGTAVGTLEGIITMTANNIIPGTAADNSVPIAGGDSATVTLDTAAAWTISIIAATTGTETITAIGGYARRIA